MDLLTGGDLMIDVRVETGALARGGDVHGRVLVQPGGSAANAAVWGNWTGARAGLPGKGAPRAPAVLVAGSLRLQEDSRPAALAALLRAEARYVAIDPASWPLVE